MAPTNLNYIELPATDLVATKTFYEHNFGWTFTDYGPGYAAAHVSGIEVALNAEATVASARPDGDQNATGPLVLLQTENLDSVESALTLQSGVIVTSPLPEPTDQFQFVWSSTPVGRADNTCDCIEGVFAHPVTVDPDCHQRH